MALMFDESTIESELDGLEQRLDQVETDREIAQGRLQNLEDALSKVEGDARLRGSLEGNLEDAENQEQIAREEHERLAAEVEVFRENLELQLDSLSGERRAVEELAAAGENTSESDAIIESRQRWLEACMEKVNELSERLGLVSSSTEIGDGIIEGNAQPLVSDARIELDGELDDVTIHFEEEGVNVPVSDFDLANASSGLNITSNLQTLYSQKRWNAALRWSDPNEADKMLRPTSGLVWRSASSSEKKAVFDYTGNDFELYNSPLNGYEKPTYVSENYVGVGLVDIDAAGCGEKIRDMTNLISRSKVERDMIVRRGDGISSLDTVFGLAPGTLEKEYRSQEAWNSLVGRSGRIGSFLSCGTTVDSGTKGLGLDMEILVPAGSQALYVEPFSSYGRGAGLSWDGLSDQPSFSIEDETILQRGGSYTLVGVEYSNGHVKAYLEVHPEDGYDTFQQG